MCSKSVLEGLHLSHNKIYIVMKKGENNYQYNNIWNIPHLPKYFVILISICGLLQCYLNSIINIIFCKFVKCTCVKYDETVKRFYCCFFYWGIFDELSFHYSMYPLLFFFCVVRTTSFDF